ncbi:MAG: hypothetical protein GWP17_01375 [Aquificales bacterium]|nr:hypothetical protein [Aquificales bacterium]
MSSTATITPQLEWLLAADEPWTRYRTLVDLLDLPEDNPDVQAVRADMLAHPLVQELVETAVSWPGYALKNHKDAKHPLYALSTLADFGFRHDDPGMAEALAKVTAHQSAEGAFQTKIKLYKSFGGMDGEHWVWMNCDAPTLLTILLKMGLENDPQVQAAINHLVSLVADNGWRCNTAPELGKFRGPGRKADPCPIANVYALKALAQIPELAASPAARTGAEMLLWHWQHATERKLYMFGLGTDYRKLKYPFVWYDILHVGDVLSRCPFVYDDPRFREMVAAITDQTDENGRYTPNSMYMAWKKWGFADKKRPSPWLTFLVNRIQKRIVTV